MKSVKYIGRLIAVSFLLLSGCVHMKPSSQELEPPSFHERPQVSDASDVTFPYVEEMLGEMTIEEKLGQLVIVGMDGKSYGDELDHLIRQYHVGGIILLGKNVSSPNGIVKMLNDAKMANKDNKLPLFLSVDEEGGRVSRLPSGVKKLPAAAVVGQKDDESFAYETGVYLADLLHVFGYNMNYAPVLDVNSNPKNPVIGDRSYSSDPEKVSKVGLSARQGMVDNGIISVVKHFPGHGDTHIDSHKSLPIIDKSLDELYETELIPFKQAISQKADVVMVAHILFPALDAKYPSSLSKKIITDLLRNELRYDGVIITDDLTMGAIVNDYTVPKAAVQSFIAGSDLLLIAGDYQNQVETIEALKTAVTSGVITEERLNESVKRILELKKRYKLEDLVVEEIDVEELNSKFANLMK